MRTIQQQLEACRRELADALEQQAVTSEILRVIASSSVDPQAVFETIVANAARLCEANFAFVMLNEEGRLILAAHTTCTPEFVEFLRGGMPPNRATTTGRAALERRPVQVLDFLNEPGVLVTEAHRTECVRTVLAVPMCRDDRLLGVISVWRREVRPFADHQIRLLETFGNQAIIAIENVRLIQELERKNRELTASLEQQTVTAEILRVISSCPADVLPVFQTIVRNAVALCGSLFANVFRFDGEQLHYVASHNTGPDYVELLRSRYPMRPDMSQVSGRVILSKSVVTLEDARADPEYDQRFPVALAWRRMLGVPMLRQGTVLGVIVVGWSDSGPVPKAQEELLRTFADQAVIAIENARLFNELQVRNRELTEALEQQTATSEILRAISQSPTDVQPVFDTIAKAAMKLCNARSANVFTFDGELLHAVAIQVADPRAVEPIRRSFPRPPDRHTVASRALFTRGVVCIPDTLDDPEYGVEGVGRWGFRSVLGVPLLRDGRPIGALALGRAEPGAFPERQVALLRTFADQAVIAIENVRLFDEIQDKSRELEIASQHKSAFLANMSHELRTPLNAIIGFTRIVMRRSQELLEPKQYENLERILASSQHLLSLINTILDLAKIEAGHIEIRAGEIRLTSVLEQCMRTVEPLVRETVRLIGTFDGALPAMLVDEEKLRQIVINLLSNAAKFTANGTIEVGAREIDDFIEIAVTDTGIGIAAEKLDLVFEEFVQADATSTRPYGGTGLGLAIARRLARLMGGDIHAESTLGAGSRFILTLPLHYSDSAA